MAEINDVPIIRFLFWALALNFALDLADFAWGFFR